MNTVKLIYYVKLLFSASGTQNPPSADAARMPWCERFQPYQEPQSGPYSEGQSWDWQHNLQSLVQNENVDSLAWKEFRACNSRVLDSVRALPSVGLGAVTQDQGSQSRSCERLKRKLVVTEVGSLLTPATMDPLNNRDQEAALNPQKQMNMMITARSKVEAAPGSLTFREQWRCS